MNPATNKCGCLIYESQGASKTSLIESSYSNLNQYLSQSTFKSECDTTSCDCGSECNTKEVKQKIEVSEIAKKGLPYEEIEAVINDNRMVLRIQKEPPRQEYEPPCDCIEPNQIESKNTQERLETQRRSNITFQKANPGCHTVLVYPHPDPKKTESNREKTKKVDSKNIETKNENSALFPTINTEENPNIFVLKIKRKSENDEKKHSLDLEFKAPRPWRKNHKIAKMI